MESLVKSNERVDDLQLDGLQIIQNPSGFCFGIDAVLISHFARAKSGDHIVDLGTGTGIIPLLLSAKTRAEQITGFEIQKDVADMAKRSVRLNQLESRIQIIEDDINNVLSHIEKQSVDVVVSNPPYMPLGIGEVNPNDYKAISRHEIRCTLEDIIRTSRDILKVNGQFYMVHRPNRLVDILALCRTYKLEPKKIRFVHPFVNKSPNIVLVQASKGGKPEVKVMLPLIVRNSDGTYTDEIYDIYNQAGMNAFERQG